MSWPCGDFLPVKKAPDPRKRYGITTTGIILRGKGPMVILANLYDVIQDSSKISTAQSKTYPSFEALIEDGWRVD